MNLIRLFRRMKILKNIRSWFSEDGCCARTISPEPAVIVHILSKGARKKKLSLLAEVSTMALTLPPLLLVEVLRFYSF